MNTDERQVVVNDREGMEFICTMEGDANVKRGSDRAVPRFLEQLSEHERRSCIRFFPESFYNLSDFEE